MSLDSSPSLDEFKDGMPSKLPDQKKRRRNTWIFILVLFIAALALGLVNFLQSDTAALMSGTGSISGIVIDENGAPVAAQGYILGTIVRGAANESGQFNLNGVPSGEQSIAVAYQGSGFEVPAFIQAGQNTNLGELKYTSTLEPQE